MNYANRFRDPVRDRAGLPAEDPGDALPVLLGPGWPTLADPAADLAGSSDPVRYSIEADDGLPIVVTPERNDLGRRLEIADRVREIRERERSSVPPVYNFGSGAWSAGGEQQ